METAVRDSTDHFVERRRPGSRPPLGTVFVERRAPRPVLIRELDDLHADDIEAFLADDFGYGFGPSGIDAIQAELVQRATARECDRVVAAIVDRFDRTLPAGYRIDELDLSAKLGTSRTPLREALKVLASEGIVTLTPHRGASVSALTVAEIEEVFPIIGALEALSGEIACSRITDAEVETIRDLHGKMVASWTAGQIQSYFRLNQSIHEAILVATRNETLKTLYRSLSGRLFTAQVAGFTLPCRAPAASSSRRSSCSSTTAASRRMDPPEVSGETRN